MKVFIFICFGRIVEGLTTTLWSEIYLFSLSKFYFVWFEFAELIINYTENVNCENILLWKYLCDPSKYDNFHRATHAWPTQFQEVKSYEWIHHFSYLTL